MSNLNVTAKVIHLRDGKEVFDPQEVKQIERYSAREHIRKIDRELLEIDCPVTDEAPLGSQKPKR